MYFQASSASPPNPILSAETPACSYPLPKLRISGRNVCNFLDTPPHPTPASHTGFKQCQEACPFPTQADSTCPHRNGTHWLSPFSYLLSHFPSASNILKQNRMNKENLPSCITSGFHPPPLISPNSQVSLKIHFLKNISNVSEK